MDHCVTTNCLANQLDTRWRAGPERWTYIKYYKKYIIIVETESSSSSSQNTLL
jgi:hypothetical protein